MSAPRWEGAGTRLPDGHTILETLDRGDGEHGWAIVDQGARLPENSDDGILWLDTSRSLQVGRHRPTIPLLDSAGDSCSTPTDAATTFYLSRTLRWTVEDSARGHFYNVT